jgi:hypothetical protein
VVLDDEVEQVGTFFLDAWVQVLAVKGLVNGTQGALEPLSFSIPNRPSNSPFIEPTIPMASS